MNKNTVLCIQGATGTGKSAVALSLARCFGGCIINADSRQLYRDFPILTAQPAVEEQALCPHRLYGILPCTEKMTAGVYAAQAAAQIDQCRQQGLLPILTGGTGLYIDAVFKGIANIPPVPPEISRYWTQLCAERGAPALHRELARRDPVAAARLHPHDSQRICRALEVVEGTGQPLHHWHGLPVQTSPYRVLRLSIHMPLDRLTPRLAGRIDAMLAAGAVEEAGRAAERWPDASLPGWSGIGCAELYGYLRGQYGLDECRALWLRNTRAYAKRQITWFKRDAEAITLAAGDAAALEAAAVTAAETFLEGQP